MSYLHWLLAISLVFTVLERLLPWRPMQPLLRKGLVSDLGWLAINGHLFGLGTAGLMAGTSAAATAFLRGWGLAPGRSPVAEWPFAAQFAAFLVVADFLQWGVHNLLHRVPFLWAFHKVHHSVTTMDWLGNFRFHWMEIIVYKTLQWLPLAWLGASTRSAPQLAADAPLAPRPLDRGRDGQELRDRSERLGLPVRHRVLAA